MEEKMNEKLHEALKEKLGIKHNWTEEKMDECRKVFMENILHYYFNYSGKYRSESLRKTIELYSKIEGDVGRLKFHEKEIMKKFHKWAEIKEETNTDDLGYYLEDDLKEAFTEGYLEGLNEKNS